MFASRKGTHWTPEQKLQHSRRLRLYWATHPNSKRVGTTGKSPSPEVRLRISLAQKGKPRLYAQGKNNPNSAESLKRRNAHHPNWRGGITPVNKQIRNTRQFKQWRRKIYRRDNYTCIRCLATGGEGKTITLNAHHIYPFAQYPSVRFKLENGRTLCLDCHRKTDSYGGKSKRVYQTSR